MKARHLNLMLLFLSSMGCQQTYPANERKLSHKEPMTVQGYLFLKDKLGIPEAKVCVLSPTLQRHRTCQARRIPRQTN